MAVDEIGNHDLQPERIFRVRVNCLVTRAIHLSSRPIEIIREPLDRSRHWGATPSAMNRRLFVELCRNGLIAE